MKNVIQQDRTPQKSVIAGVLLAVLILSAVLIAVLHWEKTRWVSLQPAGWEEVEAVDLAAAENAESAEAAQEALEGARVALHLSLIEKEDGIRVEGALFDPAEPTYSASKTIVLQPVGTQAYLGVPTVLVRRHDLTKRYGEYEGDRWDAWLWDTIRLKVDREWLPTYDGAGFAAWISRRRLQETGPCRLYILDEDNDHHYLVDTHQEVGR